MTQNRAGRRGGPHSSAAAMLVIGGLALLLGGPLLSGGSASPPQPTAAEAGAYAHPDPAGLPAQPARPVGPVLGASTPTRLQIPAIGVDSDLLSLGLNPDGSVAVPPYEKDSKAGWYQYSPTPGQPGPAVLLGHVHSARYGPGVFFNLGALHPGDAVWIERADRTVAVFHVDAVAAYPKDRFPTATVYGATANAALRLITCGGTVDPTARTYADNIVVFASLVSSHPA